MNKKQKEKKKKNRLETAKKRVLARRNSLRKQTSEKKQAERLEKKFREKIKPYVKDPEKRKNMMNVENKKIMSKLEKNAQILKALEDQYVSEVERKKIINENLESEGHSGLKEKMDALEAKTKQILENQKEEEKYN